MTASAGKDVGTNRLGGQTEHGRRINGRSSWADNDAIFPEARQVRPASRAFTTAHFSKRALACIAEIEITACVKVASCGVFRLNVVTCVSC